MLYDTVDSIYSQNQQRMTSRSQHRSSGGTFASQSVLMAVQRFVNSVEVMNETIMVPCRLLDMDLSSNENQKLPELLQGDNDPYTVYGMLNATKNDLMYGLPKSDEEELLRIKKNQDTSSDKWSSPCESSSSSDTTSMNSYHCSNTSAAGTNGNTSSCNGTSNINTSASNSSINSTSTASAAKPSAPSRRESTLSMISVGSNSSDSSGESDIVEESQDGNTDEVDSALGSEDTSSAITVAQANAELREHLIGLYSCLSRLSDTALFISDRYQEDISE